MTLTDQDRTDITDLINLHGHLVDTGDLDRAGDLFTQDVAYDVGSGVLRGTAALRAAALALGQANPVGHHVTNIVITPVDDDEARVRSKGLGIMADGTAGSVTYDDVVTRHPDGWKISHRTITARRTALGGPRDVLARYRRAAVTQSAEDLRGLYADDAVHEFPFAYPGVPTRLDGRDEIVDWVTTGWRSTTLRYAGYRTLAIHDTTDPNTITVEQEAITTDGVALPNIVVLTVRNGQITHLRDYVDVPAAAAALGQDVG